MGGANEWMMWPVLRVSRTLAGMSKGAGPGFCSHPEKGKEGHIFLRYSSAAVHPRCLPQQKLIGSSQDTGRKAGHFTSMERQMMTCLPVVTWEMNGTEFWLHVWHRWLPFWGSEEMREVRLARKKQHICMCDGCGHTWCVRVCMCMCCFTRVLL